MNNNNNNNKTTMKLYNKSYTEESNNFVPFIIWENNSISKPNNKKQVNITEPVIVTESVPIWDNLPPLISPITVLTQEKHETNPWNTNKNNKKKSFAEILKESKQIPKQTKKQIPKQTKKQTKKQTPKQEPPKQTPKQEPPKQIPKQEPPKITNKIIVKKKTEVIIPKPLIPVPKNVRNIIHKPKMSWADLEDSDYESENE